MSETNNKTNKIGLVLEGGSMRGMFTAGVLDIFMDENIPVDGINEDTVRNLDTDDYIIVYCQSGNRSRQAALKLLDLGYINVFDYGSIDNYDGEIINKETNE